MIRINDLPAFYIKAINKGLIKFGKIINECNQFKNFAPAQAEFTGALTFVEYYGTCETIQMPWKRILSKDSNDDQAHDNTFEYILSDSNPLNTMYIEIVNRKRIVIDKLEKWELMLKEELSLADLYTHFSITNSAKLRSFQYNIMQHVLLLNDFLRKEQLNLLICVPFAKFIVKTWYIFSGNVKLFKPSGCRLNPFFAISLILQKWKLYLIAKISYSIVLMKTDNISNLLTLIAKYHTYRNRLKTY